MWCESVHGKNHSTYFMGLMTPEVTLVCVAFAVALAGAMIRAPPLLERHISLSQSLTVQIYYYPECFE